MIDPEELPPMAVVPIEGRGTLPFALIHGESLLAAASWAVGAAELHLLDLAVTWEGVRESARDDDRPLVVHDPLCPLTPVDFLLACLDRCRETGAVVVGCRPVSDTVKHARAPEAGVESRADESAPPRLGATVDRERLVTVTSPLVLPAAVVAELESLDTRDLPRLVGELLQQVPVQLVSAPPLGRRIGDERDLEVLAALSRVQHAHG